MADNKDSDLDKYTQGMDFINDDQTQEELDLKNLNQEEKFKKIAEHLNGNKALESGDMFLNALLEFSKHADLEEDKMKTPHIVDMMESLMISKKLIDSENSILELYLKEKYENELKELRELQSIEKKREFTEEEFLRSVELNAKLENPLKANKELMTAEEYYMSNVLSPDVINELKDAKPEEMQPFINSVKKDINDERVEIEGTTGIPKDTPDENVLMASVVSAFKSSFDGKASSTFSVAKIAFNPVGFGIGLVAKTAMGVFMKTPAGEALAEKASEKWNKITNNGKRSKLAKTAILGLATVGVIGATWAGYEDSLPPSMQQVFDAGVENTKEAYANLDIKGFFSNAGEKLTSLVSSNDTISKLALDANEKYEDIKAVAESKLAEISNPSNGTSKGFFAKVTSWIDNKTAFASNATTPATPTAPPVTSKEALAIFENTEATHDASEIPPFETVTIESGDRLETIAKNLLPDNASYQEIQKLTLKIADANGYVDANKIQIGAELKIPTDLDTSGVTAPVFKLGSIDDIKNISIPYGANVSTKDLSQDILKLIAEKNPDISDARLSQIETSLNSPRGVLHYASKDGFIDTGKSGELAKDLGGYFGDDILQASSQIEGDKVVINKAKLSPPKLIDEGIFFDTYQHKVTYFDEYIGEMTTTMIETSSAEPPKKIEIPIPDFYDKHDEALRAEGKTPPERPEKEPTNKPRRPGPPGK